MRLRRPAALLLAGAIASVALSACDYEGLNSLTLPGAKGADSDAITVEVAFDDVQGLVANSPVLVDDLNVGTVRKIALEGHTPVVTVSLEPDVDLPANAVAKIGQTSLLGAKHVEINAPTDEPSVGQLENGDRIDEAHSAAYPSTEEVLAGVSALLNGGGLEQIKTITTEVNKALGGREGTVRDLLANTRTFITSLDDQKTDISRALDSMNVLAHRVREGNGTIDEALRDLPPALEVVRLERVRLVQALESLGTFGAQTQRFLAHGGGRNLVANVKALTPTLKGLADSGESLIGALWAMPTIIFPLQTIDQYMRGDYVNLWATVDARVGNLVHGLLGGTPLDGLLGTPNMLLGTPVGGTANQATDPFSVPPATPAPKNDQSGAPSGGDPGDTTGPTADPTNGGGLAGLLSTILGGSK